MELGDILIALVPAAAGVVALLGGIKLLRPRQGEERTPTQRTFAGVFCLLVMVGCLLTSFALGLCLFVARSIP